MRGRVVIAGGPAIAVLAGGTATLLLGPSPAAQDSKLITGTAVTWAAPPLHGMRARSSPPGGPETMGS